MAVKKSNPKASAAVQAVVGGEVVHTLRKPYLFDGEEHSSISLNLKGLTGKDLADIQMQWTTLGFFSMQPEVDTDFCILVAAHSAGKVPEFFEGLPAPEYVAIDTQVKVFLQGAFYAASTAGKAAEHGLELQLEKLTGRDLSQVKSEWAKLGGRAPLPATDLTYCALVAARAANVPLEKVQALPAPIYIYAMREVSNFLQS